MQSPGISECTQHVYVSLCQSRPFKAVRLQSWPTPFGLYYLIAQVVVSILVGFVYVYL